VPDDLRVLMTGFQGGKFDINQYDE
jgi:hypothetical protein